MIKGISSPNGLNHDGKKMIQIDCFVTSPHNLRYVQPLLDQYYCFPLSQTLFVRITKNRNSFDRSERNFPWTSKKVPWCARRLEPNGSMPWKPLAMHLSMSLNLTQESHFINLKSRKVRNLPPVFLRWGLMGSRPGSVQIRWSLFRQIQ